MNKVQIEYDLWFDRWIKLVRKFGTSPNKFKFKKKSLHINNVKRSKRSFNRP